jgi:hypothetical protein
MHAPLSIPPDQSRVHHHTWRNGSNGSHYFNSDYARTLIEEFNATGDETLNRFLTHAEPLIYSIIEYRNTIRHESADELLSRIRVKLWKSLRLYDPQKGTAFSFVARVIQSTSASIVAEAWARSEKFCEFNESSNAAFLCDPIASHDALADIRTRVREVRTPCRDRAELAAQRWLVDSFLDCEFYILRHQAANAMMEVYGLGHDQSRRLFDLTLVAVRRQLIDDRNLTPVVPSSLARTRSEALIRFAKFLNSPEFTRLVTLLKDVAPSIILTINPSNISSQAHSGRRTGMDTSFEI